MGKGHTHRLELIALREGSHATSAQLVLVCGYRSHTMAMGSLCRGDWDKRHYTRRIEQLERGRCAIEI